MSICWFCHDAANFSHFAQVSVTDLCFSYSYYDICLFQMILLSVKMTIVIQDYFSHLEHIP